MINSLKFPILLKRTAYEQILLISLKTFDFEPELLKAPKTLKDFAHYFNMKKKVLIYKNKKG